MKKLFLIFLLLSIPMLAAAEEDNTTWFVNGVYGFDIPEGWTYTETGMGELIFGHENFSNNCFVRVSQPHPAVDFDLGTYTGLRAGLTFDDLRDEGEGVVVEERAQELAGRPGVLARLAIMKDKKELYSGIIIGSDYNGYFVTFTMMGAANEFSAFFDACGELMAGFAFDPEYAESYHDELKEMGDKIEYILKNYNQLRQQ